MTVVTLFTVVTVVTVVTVMTVVTVVIKQIFVQTVKKKPTFPVVTVVTVVTIVTIVTVATVVTVVTKKTYITKKFIDQNKKLPNFFSQICFAKKKFTIFSFFHKKTFFRTKKITKKLFSPGYFLLKTFFTLKSRNLFTKKIKQLSD